jgi:serine/threonine protein kinase
MQYLEGETLADRIAKGALPLADALAIAVQIAGALDRAHRAGIVHRDLKPAHVMLTKSGSKLLDFGLAKHGAGAAAGVAQAFRGRCRRCSVFHLKAGRPGPRRRSASSAWRRPSLAVVIDGRWLAY